MFYKVFLHLYDSLMWEWISLVQSQYQTHSSGGEHRSWLKECYNSLFQAEQTKGYTKAQHRINKDYLNYKCMYQRHSSRNHE